MKRKEKQTLKNSLGAKESENDGEAAELFGIAEKEELAEG